MQRAYSMILHIFMWKEEYELLINGLNVPESRY